MIRRLVLVCLALLPAVAFALTLDEAREQGLIGEDWNGYVAAVSATPSADVQALVADVNAKRKAVYEKIAKQNSTAQDPVSADEIARVGAPKVFEKAPAGTFVRSAAGQPWKKKA
jgi:uncharacterized protein YdbL (DUF1318 family)